MTIAEQTTESVCDEEQSPQETVRERLAALAAADDQLRALVPSPQVRAAVSQPGLTLAEILATAMAGYGDRPALGRRDYVLTPDSRGTMTKSYLPTFSTISYRQLQDRVEAIATALREDEDHPVREGDFIATLAFSSPDCLATEFAAFYLRAVSVPLQTNMPVTTLAGIMAETKPQVLFTSCEYLEAAVSVAEAVGVLPKIVVIDIEERDADDAARLAMARQHLAATPTSLLTIHEVVAATSERPWTFTPSQTDADDRMAVLLYTSGSTGRPKGAIYTEGLCKFTWLDGEQPGPKVTLSWAPLNHMVGRNDVCRTVIQGGTTYFAAKSDLSTYFEDMHEVAPTFIALVPRVAEMIHARYHQELLAAAGSPGDDDAARARAHAAIRQLLGGRLVSGGIGSAPTTPELLEFLQHGLGLVSCPTGLGSTETGSISWNHRINRGNVEDYKLRDVPESGYFVSDQPFPRGELLVRTRGSIPGYFNSPEATAALYVDGYVATGDVVEERGPDHIVWIDRKNNVLKLSQGEYVTLGRLEALFSNNSSLLQQIYLYGNPQRSYLVAVVVPDRDEVRRILGDDASVSGISHAIQEELRTIAREADLAPYEVPRELLVEEEPFTVGNGLLSTMRKPLRGNLKNKYAGPLEALYAEAERRQQEGLQTLNDAGAASVLDRVVVALTAVLGLAAVDPEEPHTFRALGGDSLNAVELEALMGEVFGVEVPASVILGPNSCPRALAAYIDAAQRPDGQTVAFADVHGDDGVLRADDLQLERFMDPATLLPARSAEGATRPRRILITGANGYLGRFLCLEWLAYAAQADASVVCLVRAGNDAEARQRLEAVFDTGDPNLLRQFTSLSTGRLEVLAGEIAEKSLGLDDDAYRRLAAEVDHVVHGAALVNHTMAYRSLFTPNVVGTANLIRFALTEKQKPFEFISSVAALRTIGAASAETESVDIRTLAPTLPLSDAYASGYGASKWAGEVLLRQAHERWGLPVNVYRSDMILGHSTYPGQINSADVFTRLLFSIAVTGLAPRSFYLPATSGTRPHYDGLPVDFTAAAMQQIGAEPHHGFRSLNFVNSHDDGISLDRIVDWVISAGYPMERIDDYDEWIVRFEAALTALPEDERAQSTLPVLEAYRDQRAPEGHVPSGVFDQVVTELVTMPVPHLTEPYVHKCLEDLRVLGQLR